MSHVVWYSFKTGLKLLVGASVNDLHTSRILYHTCSRPIPCLGRGCGGTCNVSPRCSVIPNTHYIIYVIISTSSHGDMFVVLYSTNWQAVTQCLIVCLTSEVLRPNIPYTKWRGLLNHLSSLVLWHSAALDTTWSQMVVPVYLVRLYEWTRTFGSSSESSQFCPTS